MAHQEELSWPVHHERPIMMDMIYTSVGPDDFDGENWKYIYDVLLLY